MQNTGKKLYQSEEGGLPKSDVVQPSERNSGFSTFLSRLPAFRSTMHPPTRAQVALIYLVSLLVEAVAIWTRFVIDAALPPGFPYLTFFPAVILTGFIFGMGPAVLNAAISGIVALYWFIPPAQTFEITWQSATALLFFFVVVAIDLGLLKLLLRAYAEQMHAREDLIRHLQMQKLVSDEVDHRLKNLLATTSGLISLSQRHAETPQQLGNQLRQRIQSMGHSIALLRGSLHGASASMQDAILSALEPLGLNCGERLSFEGPALRINASAIISLNLIMHELGTNAFKYGALSGEGGKIRVRWTFSDKVDEAGGGDVERWLELVWEESNGPPVIAPHKAGFGTELVQRLARGYGSDCVIDYRPEGLCVTLEFKPDTVLA